MATTTDISLARALTCRAYVEIAQGEMERAGHDAREALDVTADLRGYLSIAETLECLAYIAGDAGSHREAARLFGAADVARRQTGVTRFKILDADHEVRLAAVRDGLGESDFQAAWDEGEALTIEEAIAYARRGRGERKRPSKGWAPLTPTELDVVRLACEGLGNKEIATRLSSRRARCRRTCPTCTRSSASAHECSSHTKRAVTAEFTTDLCWRDTEPIT